MTSDEWHTCSDPSPMLTFLGENQALSERKARLFCVACCRRVWHLLPERSLRWAVEVAESYADGLAGNSELRVARHAVRRLHDVPGRESSLDCALHAVSYACRQRVGNPGGAAIQASWAAFFEQSEVSLPTRQDAELAEQRAQCSLLRDFCHPFQPFVLDACARTPTVLSLATAAYRERDPQTGLLDRTRLAILADSLEDGNCTDTALLEHLRGPSLCVKGCAALDAILLPESVNLPGASGSGS